jgi:hypothetical protein
MLLSLGTLRIDRLDLLLDVRIAFVVQATEENVIQDLLHGVGTIFGVRLKK